MGIPSVNYTVSGQDFDIPVDETEQTDPTEFLIKALKALENHTHATTKGLPVNTVPSGGLQIVAGNLCVGSAPAGNAAFVVNGSTVSGATSQYGMVITPTSSSGATAAVIGIESVPQTAAASFTCAQVIGLHAKDPIKGAGSTITSNYGLFVDSMTMGGTNNYGVFIQNPSGGNAIGLRCEGAVQFSLLGARQAGDVYVIVDASGNLHKSAIGPAS